MQPSLDEMLKKTEDIRSEYEKYSNDPETVRRVKESNEKHEEYMKREKEYKDDVDYYEDIYYESHLLGLYKTYHSYFSHGKRIKKELIPESVIHTIRDQETFTLDNMRRLITESFNHKKKLESNLVQIQKGEVESIESITEITNKAVNKIQKLRTDYLTVKKERDELLEKCKNLEEKLRIGKK